MGSTAQLHDPAPDTSEQPSVALRRRRGGLFQAAPLASALAGSAGSIPVTGPAGFSSSSSSLGERDSTYPKDQPTDVVRPKSFFFVVPSVGGLLS
jgi:hypothetical protein